MSAIDQIIAISAKDNLSVSGVKKYKATINLPVICAIDPKIDPFDMPTKIRTISINIIDWTIFKSQTYDVISAVLA